MSDHILLSLKTLLQTPDIASKKWVTQQYDSQVMNDTIYTKGDAAIVRVHNTKKALALTTDCTPRYVEADPFEGSKQAVAETYRNICSVGARPLAITNCLNFGNPQRPEIMGQIVKSIQGITEACKELDYPVVSGNVSLYNETDGKAIKPTPAIGGVGLIKDYLNRCSMSFKSQGDEIYIIGSTNGHLSCSLYERDILKIEAKANPPKVDLGLEKKNGIFVQELIERSVINSCHDVSDGGILIALFEMCANDLGFEIDVTTFINENISLEQFLFGEDQSRYIITISKDFQDRFVKKAKDSSIDFIKIGNVIKEKIYLNISNEKPRLELDINELRKINEEVFEKKFS